MLKAQKVILEHKVLLVLRAILEHKVLKVLKALRVT